MSPVSHLLEDDLRDIELIIAETIRHMPLPSTYVDEHVRENYKYLCYRIRWAIDDFVKHTIEISPVDHNKIIENVRE